MSYTFPSEAWLDALVEVINQDEKYAQSASRWEGDILFDVQPDDSERPAQFFYLDLWHGACRSGSYLLEGESLPAAKFTLSARRVDFLRVLQGGLDPMQAMLTRRLQVKGDMGYMLRNVPTVLQFVRCAQQVPIQDESH